MDFVCKQFLALTKLELLPVVVRILKNSLIFLVIKLTCLKLKQFWLPTEQQKEFMIHFKRFIKDKNCQGFKSTI